MAGPNDITLVEDAHHNPAEPRHFMRIVPSRTRQCATVGDTTVADSDAALVVKEVGRDIYDAVVYFPRSDVSMDALERIDKTTHCPLKGDTEYFDLIVDGERLPAAAWSYVGEMVAGEEIRDLIAFDAQAVRSGPA